MKLRMCALVFLTAVAQVLAQDTGPKSKKTDSSNIIKEIDLNQPVFYGFPGKEVRIEDFNGVKCLINDKEYGFAVMEFDVKQSGIQALCRATTDSTPAATIGAVLFRFEEGKWKTVSNIAWNIALDQAKFKDITFKVSFDEMGRKDGKYRLILYRSNNQGKLIVEKIRVEKMDNNIAIPENK